MPQNDGYCNVGLLPRLCLLFCAVRRGLGVRRGGLNILSGDSRGLMGVTGKFPGWGFHSNGTGELEGGLEGCPDRDMLGFSGVSRN